MILQRITSDLISFRHIITKKIIHWTDIHNFKACVMLQHNQFYSAKWLISKRLPAGLNFTFISFINLYFLFSKTIQCFLYSKLFQNLIMLLPFYKNEVTTHSVLSQRKICVWILFIAKSQVFIEYPTNMLKYAWINTLTY